MPKALDHVFALSRPALAALCCTVLLAAQANCFAQDSSADALEKATEIEPYDGPPIFLPEIETPPPPSEVESKVIKQNYEDSDIPRFERRVVRYSDESLKSDGPMKEYFTNGQLLREENYSEGKANGEWRTYYKNGQLRQQTNFVGGALDGPAKEWTKLGEQRAIAEFKQGKRHGKTTLYQTDGAVIERLYDEGRLVDQTRKEADAS